MFDWTYGFLVEGTFTSSSVACDEGKCIMHFPDSMSTTMSNSKSSATAVVELFPVLGLSFNLRAVKSSVLSEN